MRVLGLVALSLAVSCLLSACAPQENYFSRNRLQQYGQCETATGQGTSVSPSYARALAEAGVRNDIADVKGALLVSGLRRVRAEPMAVTCRPYVLVGGLTQCKAIRRFCGR
jgi:hypothetical protein